MIPKTIHYCWFGRNPKPKLAEKCIRSWKRHCRGYQFIEWNEDNYDLDKAPLYVRQAYEAKKWAFVTDYVRLQVVYENGGIYMDTDVELRKKPDKLLKYNAYFGFEDGKYIATGLGFGAVQGCSILKEMMDDYQMIPFVLEDGSFDLTTCPVRNTESFMKYGLIQDNSKQVLTGDILILPQEYLNPVDISTSQPHITKQTISLHWFSASWLSEEDRRKRIEYQKMLRVSRVTGTICQFGRKVLGDSFYETVRDSIKKCLFSEK